MKNKSLKIISVSHPKDKSLEAYKTWIMEMAGQLTTERTEIQWTEEQWTENWKKYWESGKSPETKV
jgi:hypothetical protein